MHTKQELIEKQAQPIITELSHLLTWRWEDEKHVLLSEFASGKAPEVYDYLSQSFPHHWNKKNIKQAPKAFSTLGQLSKVTNNQCIFSRPDTLENAQLVALWWPWGHGSTYSLRLTALESPYQASDISTSKSFWQRLLG